MDSQADEGGGGENVRPRPRKRTRNPHDWKAAILKRRVQSGQEHVTKSGRIIEDKIFTGQVLCKCRFRCDEKVDISTQKSIFDHYYNLDCWSGKTTFLRSLTERCAVEENLDPKINLKARDFVSKYFLEDKDGNKQQICGSFLTNILQISRVTLFRATKSIGNNPKASERRGLFPTKKSDAKSVELARTFIQKFPTFESHHDYKYLHPRLSLKKMHEMYVDECDLAEVEALKLSIFRRIFIHDFDLRFAKRTKKCKTCKSIEHHETSMILSKKTKKSLTRQRKRHIGEVRSVKNNFVRCVKEITEGLRPEEVFTLALEKFEVPFVADSDILMRRPLCYNICFYDEVRKKIFMYVWDESIAPCGSQEIGSCLYRHLYNNTPTNANKVIFYCDPRSGQMRNIKIALMLQNFLMNDSNPDLEEIEQRFTISGHSRNRCTSIFSHLRKQRKESKTIYSPGHWIDVMESLAKENANCSIIKMNRNNFFDIKQLEDLIVKPFANRNQFWPNARSVIYRRDEPFTLKTKQCSDNDSPITFHLLPTTCPSDGFPKIGLPPLHEMNNLISKAKYDDLIVSLNYITDQNHHAFYKSLKYSTNNETDQDYGLELRESSEDENMSD